MRINGVDYPDYQAYLQSAEWQQYRRDRLATDHNRCVCCGAKENLQVHHLNYKIMDDSTYLVTLCQDCHSRLHKVVLPGLIDDIARLNKKYTPLLANFKQKYEKERKAIYLSWFQKMANNGRWADKGRAVRTLTLADVKGSAAVTVGFEALTNKLLSETGSGTIQEDGSPRITWR